MLGFRTAIRWQDLFISPCLPTIHEEILKQHRRRLSGEAARKHGLNQKDFKSATTQAAPVTSKVRMHSDQLKCAFG
jgi:hypothetical protein